LAIVPCGALAGCLFPSFEGMDGSPTADAQLVTQGPGPGPGPVDGGTEAAVAPSAANVDPTPPDPTSDRTAASATGDSTRQPRPAISCGSTSCDASSSICCVERTGASCRPSSSGTSGCAYTLHCDDSSQCPSDELCCGALGDATCRPKLQCGVAFGRVLCDPKAPHCPDGKTCTAVPLPGTTTMSNACSLF
jgi:hypothetical protein